MPRRILKELLFVGLRHAHTAGPALLQDLTPRSETPALFLYQLPFGSSLSSGARDFCTRDTRAATGFAPVRLRYSIIGGMKEPNCPLTSWRPLRRKQSCRRG